MPPVPHRSRISERLVCRAFLLTFLLTFLVVFLLASIACDEDRAPTTPPPMAEKSASPSPSPSATTQSPPAHPNILLITLDTVRADALNTYGQAQLTSPNLDALARRGVVFEAVSTSAPSTLPAHASIMTGLFQLRHGAHSNVGYVLPEAAQTLAETLGAAGYTTHAEIARAVIGRHTGLAQGFETFRDIASPDVKKIEVTERTPDGSSRRATLDERAAEDVTRFAVDFVDEHRVRRGDRPFFLWLHYFDAHQLYIPRPGFTDRAGGDAYLGEVLYVDASVGQVLERLDAHGLRGRTIVAVVADHGEGRGEHGEKNHANYLYESTMRVPLIISAPGRVREGVRVSEPVRVIDIAPTLLDLAGIGREGSWSAVDGTSLVPLMRGRSFARRLPHYGQSIELMTTLGASPLRSLRIGRWKYIHQPEPELYDLETDPNELRNLASEQPEKRDEMAAALQRLIAGGLEARAEMGHGGEQRTLSRDEEEQLRARGYLGTAATTGVEAALADMQGAGPPASSYAEAVTEIGRLEYLMEAGRWQMAAERVEPLISRYPESVAIQSAAGRIQAGLGNAEAAIRALRRTLELDPCSNAARVELAEVFEGQGEEAQAARAVCHRDDRCTPSSERANHCAYLLATASDAGARDPEAARAWLEIASRERGEMVEVLDTRACVEAANGEFEAAVSTLDRAIAKARAERAPSPLIELLESRRPLFESGKAVGE